MEKKDIQTALDFIEKHLEEPFLRGQAAERAHLNSYHFRRTFGMLCGIPLSEYIRYRRLSRAAFDLQKGEKVLDVAFKYDYSTSESFSRAFMKFHGVKPAEVKHGAPFKNFAPIDLTADRETTMRCEIRELPARKLVGLKARFRGVPFGEERLMQENEFYGSTLGKQWLLSGAGGGKEEEYAVLSNITEKGYDYYIAFDLDEWTQKALSDPTVTGIDTSEYGFETVELPACRAAVFTTEKSMHPIADYAALRASLVKFLGDYDFEFADLPELIVYHWHLPDRESRYIEICLPIV